MSSKLSKRAIRHNRRTARTELETVFCRWIYLHYVKKIFWASYVGRGRSPQSLPPLYRFATAYNTVAETVPRVSTWQTRGACGNCAHGQQGAAFIAPLRAAAAAGHQRAVNRGGSRPKYQGGIGGGLAPPFPSLFPLPLPLPLPFLSFPLSSLALEVGQLKYNYGVGGALYAFPAGLGRSPSGNRILCILALKTDIWLHQIY